MDVHTKLPTSKLKPFVREFYFMSIDKDVEENSGLVADDGCYELMFVKENDVCLIYGETTSELIPNSYTINNIKPPFKFSFNETLTTFCIKLQPFANTLFIPNGFPRGILNLHEIFGNGISRLQKQIFKTDSFDKQVKVSEEFLLNLELNPDKEFFLVKDIVEKILEEQGTITIYELSEQFKVSRQKLNKVFSKYVKHTLKEFSVMVRTRASIEYKLKNPHKSLTEIAYHFGYFDQAHFIRDFKKVCGVPPSSFVKNVSYSCNSLRN